MTFQIFNLQEDLGTEEHISFLARHGDSIPSAVSLGAAYNLVVETAERLGLVGGMDQGETELKRFLGLVFQQFSTGTPRGQIVGDVQETTEATNFIWRLGSSVAVLQKNGVEGWSKEFERLNEDFFASEYVLFVARLLTLKRYRVVVLEESSDEGQKTPDLLVQDSFYVECKSLRGEKYETAFRKARKQLKEANPPRPGMVCLDLDGSNDLESNEVRRDLEQRIKGSLNSTSSVSHVAFTQTRRVDVDQDTVQNPIRVGLYPHPNRSAVRLPLLGSLLEPAFGAERDYVV